MSEQAEVPAAPAAPPAPAPEPAPPAETPPAEPPPGPTAADFDPNKNLVYDVLHDVADLEMIGRVKWDLFSVERRLERALAEDGVLAKDAPEVHGELTLALDLFRQDDDVKAYKARFVRSEERLKLAELVRFLELAVKVREPLHAAWTRYLAWDHDRLLAELASVDGEGLARRSATLLAGARETESRRCRAVIVYTERNARQVFTEIPYRDHARQIAWYEEKNPQLANLIAEARVLYLHLGLLRQGAGVSQKLTQLAWATAAFTAVAAAAMLVSLFR